MDIKSCVECNKCKKLLNPKKYIFDKTFVFTTWNKYGNNNNRIFKEDKKVEILKTLDLINNISE